MLHGMCECCGGASYFFGTLHIVPGSFRAHISTSLPCSHFEVWPASTLKSSFSLTWVPKVHRARLEQARTAFGTLSAFARVQALARASALSAGGHHFTMNSGLSRLKYSLVVMADLPALRRGEQLRDVQKLFYESEFDSGVCNVPLARGLQGSSKQRHRQTYTQRQGASSTARATQRRGVESRPAHQQSERKADGDGFTVGIQALGECCVRICQRKLRCRKNVRGAAPTL